MTITKETKAALEDELHGLEERRATIHNLLAAYEKPERPAKLPTMDMARTVIRNAGRPLTMEKILEHIRSTYGITPPGAIIPMLERRARNNEGFFFTKEGAIGVLSMNPKIQKIETIQSTSRPRRVSEA